VDGGQHGAPVGLSLLEGARRLQAGELLSVGFGLGQPGDGVRAPDGAYARLVAPIIALV